MRTATSSQESPEISEGVGVPPNHQTERAVDVIGGCCCWGDGIREVSEEEDVGRRKDSTCWFISRRVVNSIGSRVILLCV
jgi:hypothetical protein